MSRYANTDFGSSVVFTGDSNKIKKVFKMNRHCDKELLQLLKIQIKYNQNNHICKILQKIYYRIFLSFSNIFLSFAH